MDFYLTHSEDAFNDADYIEDLPEGWETKASHIWA